MNILFLSPQRKEFQAYLASFGDRITRVEVPMDPEAALLDEVDFIVSYGYRHILSGQLLRRFPLRAINLHISLLPWNRGADPNLWSFLEDTPKGVTIHLLDAGVDTGDILAQKRVTVDPAANHTLRTSYALLSESIETLFRQVWPDIRQGRITPVAQSGPGSFHRLADRQQVAHLLTRGWDTPVSDLVGKSKR